MKRVERETGKNLLFEKVTKDKRNYNSTGNLGQHKSNMQNTTFFRGYS